MKKRKGIELDIKVILRLQKLADIDKRKLKPYIEKILTEHSSLAVRQLTTKKLLN